MFQIISNDFPIIHLLLSSLLNYKKDSCGSDSMLSSNESIAVNLGLTFINAVLHYVLYRIAVAFILFIKKSIFWVLSKSDCLITTTQSTGKRKRCKIPAKRFTDELEDSADEYVTS